MTPLQIEVFEFIVNNRDSILHYLNEQCLPLSASESSFESYPQAFDDLLENFRKKKLIDLITSHFNIDYETLSLIIDDKFVKIALEGK